MIERNDCHGYRDIRIEASITDVNECMDDHSTDLSGKGIKTSQAAKYCRLLLDSKVLNEK